MVINCNLTDTDNQAMRRYFIFRYRKMHWFVAVVLVSLLTFVWFSNKPNTPVMEKIAGLMGIAIIWVVLMLIFSIAWKITMRITGGRFRGSIGPHVFEINEDRFIESNAEGRKEVTLAGLRHIAETHSHFFVFTKTGIAFVIPKRDLQNVDAIRELQKKVVTSGNRPGAS
jgi:hypothetical protein